MAVNGEPREQLREMVLDVLVARWDGGEREIDCEDVYGELVDAGEEIPEGAMEKVFQDLEGEGLIECREHPDRDTVKEHGMVVVTWVNASGY
jgi:hypothetical protein